MTNVLAERILQFHLQSGAAPIDKNSLIWLLERWKQLPLQRQKTLTTEALNEATGLIKRHFSQYRAHNAALNATLSYLVHVLGWTIPTKKQQSLHQQDQQRFLALAKQGNQVAELTKALPSIFKRDTTTDTLDIGVTVLYLLTHMAPLSLRHLVTIVNDPDCLAILDDGAPIVYFELGRDLANDTPHAASYGIDLIGWQRLKRHHQLHSKTNETALLTAINRTLTGTPLYFDELSKGELTVLIQAYWHTCNEFDMPTLRDWTHPELSAAIPRDRLLKPALKTPNKKRALTQIYSMPRVNNASGNKPKKWPHKVLISSFPRGGNKDFDGHFTVPTPTIDADNVLPYIVFEQVKQLFVYGGKNTDSLANASIAVYTSLDGLLEANPLTLTDCTDENAITAWAQRLTDLAENDSQRVHLRYLFNFMATFELTEALQLDHIESSTIAPSINPNRLSPQEFGKTIECLFQAKSDSALTTLFSVVSAILGYYGALRSGEVARLRRRDISHMPGSKTRFHLDICNTAEGKTKNRRRRDVYLSLPEICAYWLRLLLLVKQDADANEPLIGFVTEPVTTRTQRYLAPVSKALQWVTQSDIRFHHLRHSGAQLLVEQVRILRSNSNSTMPLCSYDTASYDHAQNRFSEHHQGERIEHLDETALFGVVGKMLGHSHQATTRKSYLHGHERIRAFLLPEQTVFEKWQLRFILGLAPTSNDLTRHLQKLDLDYELGDRQRRKNQAVQLDPRNLCAYVVRKQRQGKKPPEALLSHRQLVHLWLAALNRHAQSDLGNYLLQKYCKQLKPTSNDATATPITWTLISAAFNTAGRHKARTLTPKQRQSLAEALRQFTPTYLQAEGVVLTHRLNANSAAIALVATLTQNKIFGLIQVDITLYANRKTQSSTLFSRLKKEVHRPHQLRSPRALSKGKSQIEISLRSALLPIDQLVSLYCNFLNQ